MKISLQWLNDWVDVGSDADALAQALTMAGIEIEGKAPAAPPMSGIVVAEVLATERHPDAEKLSVCRVSDGKETIQVVCGAPNVRAGMKASLAQVGAVLPDGTKIKKAKLRGVESHGMLCSARELGLSEDAAGLLELPDEVVPGTDLPAALSLDDTVLEVNLTPNRGDCMSVAGIAREVAAVTGRPPHAPAMQPVVAQSEARLPVVVANVEACPQFAGRVIRGVRPNVSSPLWMRERLRRAGLRSINLLVDVTNYIVLELGQPMHAYDLTQLQGGIQVRMAREGERLTLLDGQTIDLSNDILVIADERGPVGMAGVMGGEHSGINDNTTDIFLEAAHFAPDAVAGRGRRFGLITDASQRFERGVDPALPPIAIERATQLICQYAGGVPGPVELNGARPGELPAIRLRYERVLRILGVRIERDRIADYLNRLGMRVQATDAGWHVAPPSWRFDIKIEEDLLEEIARLHGYNNIEPIEALIPQRLGTSTESSVALERASDLLVDRGYQEAITYSFVDATWQAILFPDQPARELVNPISAELGVMRVSLWPGLALAARENVRRQQSRVRLFETGRKFVGSEEVEVIAGIALGAAFDEQWAVADRKIDFYDVKADLEALLQLSANPGEFMFKAEAHPALHPGQSARIYRQTIPVGWIGALHPSVAKRLDLTYPVFVFEIETLPALRSQPPEAVEISRFPAIRRDLAVIVAEGVEFQQLATVARDAAGALLRTLSVLSVYRGEQIDKGKKSIALGLNLQDTSRTLTDDDADRIMTQVMGQLRDRLGAQIRDK